MATIAAAAIVAGASIYAQKQAKKKSKNEKRMEQLGLQNAQLAGDYGKELMGKSRQALDPVYDYYNKMATGDRESLMQYFSKDIAASNQAAQRNRQTAMQLNPRSGMGSTAVNSSGPMDAAAMTSRMLNSNRQQGIEGLGTLGTNWGQMGAGMLNQSGSAAGNMLNYFGNRSADERAAGAQAGQSAYDIFKYFQNGFGQNKANAGGSGGADFWRSFGTTQGLGNGMSFT